MPYEWMKIHLLKNLDRNLILKLMLIMVKERGQSLVREWRSLFQRL